jgi:hypothetical protein
LPRRVSPPGTERSTALVVLGAALLVAAAVVPVRTPVTGQRDSDDVYEVSDDSYCADAVVGSPDASDPGFVHDDGTLSATGQRHVERAVADGRHVVDDEAAAAPEFQFSDDHVALLVGAGLAVRRRVR